MQSNEALRTLVEKSAVWTQNKLAKRLGLTSQAMSQRMQSKDLKAGFITEVLSILGYQLVIVPAESRLPQGSIPIDPINEPYWERKEEIMK